MIRGTESSDNAKNPKVKIIVAHLDRLRYFKSRLVATASDFFFF